MTILNYDYIKKHITKNDGKEDVPYRWSHGATDKHLGDGILIYSLIQFHKYKTLVCLGSGGGFIPRIMSKVNDDLECEGFHKSGDRPETYLVDAFNGIAGIPDWDLDSFFPTAFRVNVLKTKTEKAYYAGPRGKALQLLDISKKKSKHILNSGLPLNVTVMRIAEEGATQKINFQIPKDVFNPAYAITNKK